MNDQLQEYVKRSERYQNIDGVTETALGLDSLCAVPYFWLMATTPNVLLQIAWFYGFALVWIVINYFGTTAVRKLITYPRTGYAKPRQESPWKVVLWVALLMVVYFIADHVLLGKTLVAMTFPVIYAYYIARLDRRKWVVVIVLVFGLLAISMLPVDFGWSPQPSSVRSWGIPHRYWALYFAFFGLTLLVSGSITLYLYIRHARPPAEDPE